MASQPPKIATSVLDVTDEEKKLDLAGSTVSDPISATPAAPFDRSATKRLCRKLDLHLLPWLALIYLLCFLDRTNVGNARLFSLEKDLHMHGLDYNNALAIMFPFYVAAEIPSNMMIKRFPPSVWLTVIMVCWSVIMICMGFVQNYTGLMVARAFLGLAEGGLFPGVSYFITMWYTRKECGTRIAYFFSAATAAGAFGGLLARAISQMNHVGGYAGWRWIFILEGLLTLVIGSISYWIINDYPATATFLTPEEKVEVQRRLREDNDGENSEFDLKYAYQALRDWKIWVNCVIGICIITPLYSISLFLPTIVKDMGFTNNAAQLMTVPPYVVACACTILGSYASDKTNQRGVFMLGFQVISLIGFILLIISGKEKVQYAGTFFAASGIFSLVPLVISWNAVNIGGSLKRGVGIAMQVGFGNIGGVISAYVYQTENAPRFTRGHAILIGMTTLGFILTVLMTLFLRRENSRRDLLLSEQHLTLESITDEMKVDQRDRGDDATFFRYTV